MMDYTTYTQYNIRKIYKINAMDYITLKLKELGFFYVEPESKKIGGFNIDIYATAPTSWAKYVKKSFWRSNFN